MKLRVAGSSSVLTPILLVVACGGQQLGGLTDAGPVEGGGPGANEGGSASDGTSGPDAFVRETSSFPDAPISTTEAGVVCKPGTSTEGMGSDGSCSISVSETCSDGSSYKASCTCPEAMCSCSFSSGGGSGGGSGGIPFKGCATATSCSDVTLAWEACGFPHG